MKKSIFTLIFVLSGFASADQNDCQNVDLRRANIPMRHQGNTMWCTAFGVSDFVTFYTGQTISSVDLAIRAIHGRNALLYEYGVISSQRQSSNYFSQSRIEPNYGGFDLQDTADLAFNQGACTANLVRNDSPDVQAILLRIADAKKTYDDTVFWGQINFLNPVRPENVIHHLFRERRNDLLRIFPTMTIARFRNAILSSQKNNFLSMLSRQVCRPIAFGRPSNLTFIQAARGEILSSRVVKEKLSQVLGSQNIMIVIFNANELRPTLESQDPHWWTRVPNRDYIQEPVSHLLPEILHTLPVFGQRWNVGRNRCEVMLKDSFGSDCTALMNKRGYDPEKVVCDGGYLWVSKDLVSNNTAQMLFLQ